MDDDYLKLYEAINDRITELHKSYRILNDSHHKLERDVTEIKTKISTASSIVKWILSPIAFISLLIQILRIVKVIQ